MSAEKFINRVGNHLQRRRFLKRLGAGAAGVTAAMFGSAATANAENAAPLGPLCCQLCDSNTPIGQPCQGAYCTWAWDCCYGGRRYRCVEGYYQGQCDPDGNCTSGWRCSSMRDVGAC